MITLLVLFSINIFFIKKNHVVWNVLYQQAVQQTGAEFEPSENPWVNGALGKKRNATSPFNFRSFTPSLTKTYDLMWCCALLITCVQMIILANYHFLQCKFQFQVTNHFARAMHWKTSSSLIRHYKSPMKKLL